MVSSEVMSQLKTLQPEISQHLAGTMALAEKAADPALMALCTSYIDAALNNQNWDVDRASLTDKEQAFIAFTEQFVMAVSDMTDKQVQRLLQYASADEVYGFVNALYVRDMTRRLDLVAGRVL